ncbi:hypothetical protein A0U92_09040 [Acetobacter aceti]|uniref:Uncharacterized protein n=1 Tax=Acetobacter aceti TaxID=435 RepID=A0A1U9KGG0_ACEAC|nr:hypothetical protein A0U92_09040 [Acetobacter aceti]
MNYKGGYPEFLSRFRKQIFSPVNTTSKKGPFDQWFFLISGEGHRDAGEISVAVCQGYAPVEKKRIAVDQFANMMLKAHKGKHQSSSVFSKALSKRVPEQIFGNLQKAGARAALSISWHDFVVLQTELELSQPGLPAEELHIPSLQSDKAIQGNIQSEGVDVALVTRGCWLPAHDAGMVRQSDKTASQGIG